MNANEPVTIFFWAGEKLLRMRSLAKKRKERIMELEKRITELEDAEYWTEWERDKY